MLTRSFLPESERGTILAYTPMFHARLFADSDKYRDSHFQATNAAISPISKTGAVFSTSSTTTNLSPDTPYLDGNPSIDRPLFVQFCANDPVALLAAAKNVVPYCDAVDLNLGCPQGIAKKGHYGSFLQEDQELIHNLIKTLHENLPIPVTAKIRILDTKEATLAYAKNVLSAGASILTVHGRRREQKGHLTGLADWEYIRYLRESLPPETVIFANGNVLQHGDLAQCLEATGADAVMSAEGNLSDPALFAVPPPVGQEGREYWRGVDGRGGYRVDAVLRRYLDILHKYVMGQEPPARRPLFVVGDDEAWLEEQRKEDETRKEDEEPARKKRRKDSGAHGAATNGVKPIKWTSATAGPNFCATQAHLFHLLRHFVTKHTDVRDMLVRTRLGDITGYEKMLSVVERKVAEGILEYERTGGASFEGDAARNGAYEKGVRGEGTASVATEGQKEAEEEVDDPESSVAAVRRCKRPWWVVQPIIRPLPKEAMAKGAIALSKKEKAKLAASEQPQSQQTEKAAVTTASTGESTPSSTTLDGDANGDEKKTKAEVVEKLENTTSFPDSGLVSG